ncbi:MAG TPA: GNAT family N-acetyltransferase [Pseudonocardiaceae bacterium]
MAYVISDDPARLDLDVAHAYLAGESYWSPGIPRATFERAVANSLCLGAYAPDGAMVGFARVVTDRATFAWLCDVFVLAAHRGHGLGRRLVRAVQEHPDLRGLRRMMLATEDAHDLYRPFGYGPVRERLLLELTRPARELYAEGTPASASSTSSTSDGVL